MCSEGKKKAIYAVSKELGIGVDWKGLDKLSDEQASERIDELKAKLESSKRRSGGDSKSEPQINNSRLRMCFKLVYSTVDSSYWQQHKEKFKREVIATYMLAAETEKAVKAALSEV